MKENFTIGFLTSANPLDKRTWSGTYFKMYQALSDQFSKIEVLGPVTIDKKISFIIRLLHYVHRILFFKRYNNDHNFILSMFYAKKFRKILKNKNIDLLFAPAASAEIALLKTKIPICYLSDSSFNQMKTYYEDYTSISPLSCKESDYLEQKVINKSLAVTYPSKWAANHVIKHYKAEKEKVHVVKFGANQLVASTNFSRKPISRKEINLLFVGVDWKRKGGDIVFKTLEILLQNNINANLTVVGTVPPVKHKNMKVISFLDKNDKQDLKKFEELYSNSTLLFVPTRAECYGIVFCEACAYGLPSITTNTGGVSAIIEDGYNGYALSPDAGAELYANKIMYLIDHPDVLEVFSINARAKFESELNWNIWGERMRDIIINTINKA